MNGTVKKVLAAAVAAPLAFAAFDGFVPRLPAQAQQIQQLPTVADLAEKLSPAVVSIATTQKVAGGVQLQIPELPPDVPFRDMFEDFFKRQRPGGRPEPRTVNSQGSGFVIDASGLIVTNNHVIEQSEEISVVLNDGTNLKAELVGRDAKTDIAVLRVKPDKPLTAVSFGDSDKLRVGDWVLAIGNPFGLGGSVSLGIVSARNRDINAGPYDDFIQTDAAINKGNSGGPLFNLNGDVVGVNTAIYSPSGGSVGIGFSVPAATVKGVVDQLVQYGETRRGWLGVRIQSLTDDLAEGLDLGKAQGALIAEVTPTGPAEKAGLKPRDVITEFDGKPIREMKDLPRVVADTPIGKKVAVKVMREGKIVELSAEVGRLEDGEKLAAAAPEAAVSADTADALGMKLSIITDEQRQRFKIDEGLEGAIVTDVDPNGPAAEKRIEPGDVIVEAGQKPVKTPGDVTARIKDAESASKKSVLLYIAKGGKQSETRFIAVRIKKD
ncbi:DegQ family serine endoprotease [Aestuariivirga sp. YIM B02566]|uniref:DegQ family serine endoprotease n=1 Tax=Taklimakanibacter albus TaxID=2800327 RepID=A0ACC5QYB5_9HYPH|nr:DegQ family serine endoprotease [Aestuariivirga sp. YIM B02566]